MVSFVHATDPHLLNAEAPLPDADRGDAEKVAKRKSETRADERADTLNAAAFTAMMRSLGALPDEPVRPSFLALTGDFGLESLPADKSQRASAVKRLAELLKTPPVTIKEIDLVLGNNDVAGEAASGKAVDAARLAVGEIRADLAGSGIVLRDLSACYQDESLSSSDCYADVGGSYRLVGFPSYSFKAKAGGNAASYDAQAKQMSTFAALISGARAAGRKALVLSHIPEIDDPFLIAQDVFADHPLDLKGAAERPKWSAWDVSGGVFKQWQQLVDSEAVAGVFAGHLHDSHKEIYYSPYPWSTRAPNRAGTAKLFLAPPLAVKLQDTSPIQARGFAVVHLDGDRISRRLFWYDPFAATFSPAPPRQPPAAAKRGAYGRMAGTVTRLAGWLWGLGSGMNDLSRAMVLMLALIAAFLTVVEVWQIPAAPSKLAPPAGSAATATAANAGGGAPAAGVQGGAGASSSGPQGGLASFLSQSNFARTVIAGIGGMIVISGLDAAFWQQQQDAKPYYLVLFVAFFLALLFSSAVLRGVGEALRSRVVLPYRPALDWHRAPWWDAARYWAMRFLKWVRSFTSTLLFFWDTFYNVIQGRNQLQTAIFEGEIVNLQSSIVRTVHRVRTAIDEAVRDALQHAAVHWEGKKVQLHKDHVRVNVSVLSDDLASLFYISWAHGSLDKPFDQHSIAWLSVFTGLARWWQKGYSTGLGLYDNSSMDIKLPAANRVLKLDEYFQPREPMDYQAFVVLPIPWSRSVSGPGYRKAGIHISFSEAKYLDWLWNWSALQAPPAATAAAASAGAVPAAPTPPVPAPAAPPPAALEPAVPAPPVPASAVPAGVPAAVPAAVPAGAPPRAASPASPAAAAQVDLYPAAGKLLADDMMPNAALHAVLRESVDVLSEVLRGFNQAIFENYILPSQRT